MLMSPPPVRGATSQRLVLFVTDQSNPETGKTGLTAGGTTLRTLTIGANGVPDATALTTQTLNALASPTAAWNSNGWAEIGAGYYVYDIPNALIATARMVLIDITGADVYQTVIAVPVPQYDVLAAGDTPVQLADALLGRNVAGGSNGGRTVARALQSGLINRIEITGSGTTRTLTMYGTDDATPLYQTTLTGVGTLGFTQSDPV